MSTKNYLKAGLITIMSFSAYSGNAQTADQQTADQQKEDKVFKYVSQMPEFSNGDVSKWMSEQITYPEAARKNSVEGKVFVAFVVMASGEVANTTIRKSSGNEQLDAEAVRVIKSMPVWKPGRDKGVAVNVEFLLPVSFKLDPPKKS